MQLDDAFYMRRALELANQALRMGECPVGALIVDKNGTIIGEGFNTCEQDFSPVRHAEIWAIEKAASVTRNWRLEHCTLYVTLEPCAMCAGAIANARIARLVFGAFDPGKGACSTDFCLYDHIAAHRPRIRSRVLEAPCAELLTAFFQTLRGKAYPPHPEKNNTLGGGVCDR